MNNIRLVKSFVCFLCVGIVLNIFPPQLCEVVQADTTINFENENPTLTCSFRCVEDYSFTAGIQTTAQWSGHANFEITFANTGNETIHDWYFTFDFNYNIENPYNCYILEHDDNLYTIGNNDWNQDIFPGESVTVGFTASSDDGSNISDMPSFYLLNTTTVCVSNSDLAYSFQEYSDWTTGFSGVLILTNNSTGQIRDWAITFNSNRPITKTDAASLTAKADGTYSVTNDGKTQNISAGQSYRIELQGGKHDSSKPLELTDLSISARTFALSLYDDKDNNGIADVRETGINGEIIVTPSTVSPTSVPTETPTNTPTSAPTTVVTLVPTISPTITTISTIIPTSVPTAEPTNTVQPAVTVTVSPTVTDLPTPVITVTPTNTDTPRPTTIPSDYPNNIDYEMDSDEDGLPDDLEDFYGTDKYDKDTDDDGVNDFYELILSTEPLIPDDNGNADIDMDGLTNAQESSLGTNPQVKDTDIDGLTDGEEYNLYGTNPTTYDTDEDGISDYNEIHLGSNPALPDSNVKRYQTLEYEPSGSSGLTGVTKVIVSGYISGAICENTKIKDIYNKDLLTSSITALVGDPVNIESTGEFDSMTITFKYTDDLNERYLRVMWFDEDNLDYVVLNDYTINRSSNTISFNTTHFSKYMLIDESIWVNTWGNNMAMTRNTSALGSSHSLSGYKSKMGRLDDRDSDGLPDIFETNGMLIQTGNVIYTDPSDPDTDKDGLLDGEEMGVLSLTSIIFDRTYFYDYIHEWYAGYGYREFEFAFFKMKSNPTLFSSDSDTSSDKDDATINDENEPINYILYYKEPQISWWFLGNKSAYIACFNKLNMLYECFEINDANEYDSFWRNMCHQCTDFINISDDCFTDKERYGKVRNLIIIFHGVDTKDGFNLKTTNGNWLTIEEEYISESADFTNYVIENIDLQSCFALRDYDNDGNSVATLLANKDNLLRVYATDGPMRYNGLWNLNWTADGYLVYLVEKDSKGEVQIYPISQYTPLLFWEGNS